MLKKYSFFILLLILSCSSVEERRVKWEKRLESLIGKSPNDIIYEFGNPHSYLNEEDEIYGKNPGTYMIYNKLDAIYRDSGNVFIDQSKYPCKFRFKIEIKSNTISEWDYSGNGCY